MTAGPLAGCGIHHVDIVLPARDEADHVGAAIAALEPARRRVEPAATTRLVVVCDACTDGTAPVARAAARPSDTVLEVADRCAGTARRHGTERALAAGDVPARRRWLATTDADSRVPPDWLAVQLALAGTGAVGVAGTVQLHLHPEDPVHVAFVDGYELDPDGTHEHVHGANLGCRADALLRAGGWRDLATGEDQDLWRRLDAVGPCLATTAIPVLTSARRTGRAPAGLAADLARLDVTDA